TAEFDLESHLLKVTTSGSGSGTVTSSPAGINCGSGTGCEASFNHGTLVKLTGAAEGGSKAVVWGGCDSVNGSNECEVTMNAAKNVTAAFSLASLNSLVVVKHGSAAAGGTVTSSPAGINCGTECSHDYPEGTPVKLTGTPGPNGTAVVWESCPGVINGANECEVTMSAARTVEAKFDLETHLLKVIKKGTGSGTVTSNPAGINCGSGA